MIQTNEGQPLLIGALPLVGWVLMGSVHVPTPVKPSRLKRNMLSLSAEQLNYGLSHFVSEVRRPSGEAYAPDSIFYLCLGIQRVSSQSLSPSPSLSLSLSPPPSVSFVSGKVCQACHGMSRMVKVFLIGSRRWDIVVEKPFGERLKRALLLI